MLKSEAISQRFFGTRLSAEYKYLSCISKAYSNDKINYEECLNLLKEYIKSNSSELNTHFRKAITYLDMKVYYSS